MNSFPIDYIGLMDLPEINKEWFISESQEFNIDQVSKPLLDTDDLFHKNYKRYFCAHEILNGFQMLNRIGLVDN